VSAEHNSVTHLCSTRKGVKMAHLESETKRYVTWLPFLIDSARRTRRGWHISKQERMAHKSKVLAPLSHVFPVLRVTYERAVAGGWTPYIPPWYYPPDHPFYKPFSAELAGLVAPEPPLLVGSSSTEVDPPMGGPFPSPPVPTDGGVHETQQEGASESSLLPPPPPPAPKLPREGI
jgi:hypothetical protein